jgi:antitoxin component of RelBE/YafQ-DinJ toxin-antitoxin module
MPNQPKTPNRSFRVPDDLWDQAKERADATGETMTSVINRLLTEYINVKPTRNARRVSS